MLKKTALFLMDGFPKQTHLKQIYNCDGDGDCDHNDNGDDVDDHQHHHHRDYVEDGDDFEA